MLRELERLSAIEEVLQNASADTGWDSQSTISADSVAVLSPKQKQDIIKKFTEALLKDMPNKCLISHGSNLSKVPFRQRFQSLLKEYSDNVKNDTPERSRKQAAKQIRILRCDICNWCEEVLRGIGITAKDQRVYPNIAKEAEKVNLPEKTWKEKVGDWSKLLHDEAMPTVPFDVACEVDSSQGRSYTHQHESQNHALFDGAVDGMSAANLVSLSDFEDEIPSSNGNNAQVVHIDAAEDRDIYEYLTTHDAFRHLVSEVRGLVERHYSNQMELVRHCVLLSIRRPLHLDAYLFGHHNAMFHVDWDLITFLQSNSLRPRPRFGSHPRDHRPPEMRTFLPSGLT